MSEQIAKNLSEIAYPEPENKELQELIYRAIDQFVKNNGISIEEGKMVIPRNYLIDSSFAVMWSPNDFDTIVKKLIADMNTGRLKHDEYFRYLNRCYNDQSVVLDKNTTLEPMEIGRKHDRITFEAVRDIWLNMMGIYQPPISHAAVGDGTGSLSYGLQSLYHEVSRVPINQANNGSIGLRGETLFVTASFSSGLLGFTMKEALTANSSDVNNDRVQLVIQFDPTDQKAHTQNNTVPQFSTSASMCTL